MRRLVEGSMEPPSGADGGAVIAKPNAFCNSIGSCCITGPSGFASEEDLTAAMAAASALSVEFVFGAEPGLVGLGAGGGHRESYDRLGWSDA